MRAFLGSLILGLFLLPNCALAVEYTTGPADWFRENGKPCPEIDEIDARMRQAHPDMSNAEVVQGTINTFFTMYYSEECKAKGAPLAYTGDTTYAAIINDYKARHPDSVSPLIGVWLLTFPPESVVGGYGTGGGHDGSIIITGVTGHEVEATGTAIGGYHLTKAYFNGAMIEITMESAGAGPTTTMEGSLVSDTRIQGRWTSSMASGNWYAEKQ